MRDSSLMWSWLAKETSEIINISEAQADQRKYILIATDPTRPPTLCCSPTKRLAPMPSNHLKPALLLHLQNILPMRTPTSNLIVLIIEVAIITFVKTLAKKRQHFYPSHSSLQEHSPDHLPDIQHHEVFP